MKGSFYTLLILVPKGQKQVGQWECEASLGYIVKPSLLKRYQCTELWTCIPTIRHSCAAAGQICAFPPFCFLGSARSWVLPPQVLPETDCANTLTLISFDL